MKTLHVLTFAELDEHVATLQPQGRKSLRCSISQVGGKVWEGLRLQDFSVRSEARKLNLEELLRLEALHKKAGIDVRERWGSNGIEATPLILKAAPKTHVIILTMHNAEEVIEKVLRSGARGFVLKSDAERDLVLAVDTVMQNKPFLTSTVSEAVLRSFQQPENQAYQRQQNQDRLTKRERQVVRLLAEGKSNKEAAAVLVLSTRTVESHRATITRKLGARSFSDLLRYAIRNKLIDL